MSSEWTYKGKQVFLIQPNGCCDIETALYDKDGNKICVMGGGFAGQTDEACKDFQKEAKPVRKFATPTPKQQAKPGEPLKKASPTPSPKK